MIINKDLKIGDKVRLLPNTQHLISRIAAFGNDWTVLRTPINMPCFSGSLGVAIINNDNNRTRNVRLIDIEKIND